MGGACSRHWRVWLMSKVASRLPSAHWVSVAGEGGSLIQAVDRAEEFCLTLSRAILAAAFA